MKAPGGLWDTQLYKRLLRKTRFPIYVSPLHCLPLAGSGFVFQANCLSIIYVRAIQQGVEASTPPQANHISALGP